MDVVVLFKNGRKRFFENVTSYGYRTDNKTVFYIEKRGLRSFFPAENILFFGSKDLWEEAFDDD